MTIGSLAAGLLLATFTAGSLYAQQPPAPAAAPPAPTPGPTLAQALKAMELAKAAADKINVKLSCVVVDSRGDLVAVTRMDGARYFTTDVARGKALTSATFGRPSAEMIQFGSTPMFQNFNTAAQGRLYPIQGALPIQKNNQTIGAMGCSGASSQQDEDAVRAALAAF
ncbi:MAG: heme-binding protein [Vicinamibacterales bacterium]